MWAHTHAHTKASERQTHSEHTDLYKERTTHVDTHTHTHAQMHTHTHTPVPSSQTEIVLRAHLAPCVKRGWQVAALDLQPGRPACIVKDALTHCLTSIHSI